MSIDFAARVAPQQIINSKGSLKIVGSRSFQCPVNRYKNRMIVPGYGIIRKFRVQVRYGTDTL